MARELKQKTKAIPLGLIAEDAAAASLKVSTRTLQRYREQGRIKFYRVGVRVYYTEEMIRDYLDRSCASVALSRSPSHAVAA